MLSSELVIELFFLINNYFLCVLHKTYSYFKIHILYNMFIIFRYNFKIFLFYLPNILQIYRIVVGLKFITTFDPIYYIHLIL